MLFNMLNNEIGDDAFYRGLKGLIKEKAFQDATWDDVRKAFEISSNGTPILKRLFGEWKIPGPGFSLAVVENPLNI
jgi:hypothetical protein